MKRGEPVVVARIEPCPRCGGDHKRLELRPFVAPSRSVFTHWAICPSEEPAPWGNCDPLLVAYDEDEFIQSKTA